MCGIAGWFNISGNHTPPAGLDEAMLQTIAFRGRDSAGIWHQPGIATLLHTRLSIIDLADGAQPMKDSTGRFVIIFNGEIYNYLELRATYAGLNARFMTHSDTEVILEGYKLKGDAVCNDLNGMFAFAIWDTHKRTLFVARDRMGKKPFYWMIHRGIFYFSSSLNTFHVIPGWDSGLCASSIALYGVLGTFPENLTAYQNAQSLPAASWSLIKVGATTIPVTRYWRLNFADKFEIALPALMDEYENILTDAIRIRLRSDVPLALSFSGGVDSGTIAAIAKRKLGQSLRCFTIDYHTPDDPSEETLIAERVAGLLELPWQFIHFDYHSRLLDDLAACYRVYDQPCNQLSLVYSQHLYKAIKPYATVVMSGNGADELFTGYIGDERVYRKQMLLKALRGLRPWMASLPVSAYLKLPLPYAYIDAIKANAACRVRGQRLEERVVLTLQQLTDEAMEAQAESALDLKMFFNLKCSGAVDSNYRVPDISGLAAQVEVRSPFLDYRMVAFAARLPHQYKVSRLFSPKGNKFLPKRYYSGHVPPDVAWSRKKGMAYNMKWGISAASDLKFKSLIMSSYDRIDGIGVCTKDIRRAWINHVKHVNDSKRHSRPSQSAGSAFSGLMLGVWLSFPRTSISSGVSQNL